jgi:hypothetical protein
MKIDEELLLLAALDWRGVVEFQGRNKFRP